MVPAILIFSVGQLAAQGMPVRRFTVQDGLAQSQVTAMIQDSRGFLWVGTQAGLSRWDGMRFRTWTSTEGLPDDLVTALAVDDSDKLWIGTDSGAVARLSSSFSDPLPHLVWKGEAPVKALLPLPDGLVFLGSERGLFLVGKAERQLLSESIAALVRREDGRIWVLGEKTARVFSPEGRELQSFQLPGNLLLACFIGRPGVLLKDGTLRGLRDLQAIEMELPGNLSPTALAGESDSNLWIGTESGLYRRSARGGIEQVDLDISLSGLNVRCLLIDREGDLWIGSWGGGLIEIPPGDMRVWTRSTAFPSSTVWAFAQDRKGRLWMATDDAGAVSWTEEGLGEVLSGFPSDRVLSLAAGPHGDLWVGTDEGLFHRPSSGYGKPPNEVEGPPNSFIRDLLYDSRGRLWVATSGGLGCLDSGIWHTWKKGDGLPDELIRGLAIDGKGKLWMATHSAGVVRFDGEDFIAFTRESGLPTNRVWCIMCDHSGRIWGGTDAGIWIHDPGGESSDRVISVREGLSSRNILFLVEDEAEEVWAGTTRGVVHLTGAGRVLEILTASDGLPGTEAAENAGFCDRDGYLWMGLDGGVARIRPEERIGLRVPPVVVPENLLVDGVPLRSGRGRLDERVVLKPGVSDLRFEISAPLLRKADRLRFSYKLEGHDPEWSLPSDERHVTYRRLPPGRYAFRVRISDGERRLSEGKLLEEIVLRPFWYQTLWARILGILLLAGLILAFLFRRWNAAVRRRKELEDLVEVRTAELRGANLKLEELSRTDPLTGLGNRRALAETLPLEMALIRRQLAREGAGALGRIHGIGVLMLDLDHFKSINDRFGHETGDDVLRGVAGILRREAREVDELVRWGGEEFVVLARGLSSPGLGDLAGRLLRAIAGLVVDLPDGSRIKVTASIGFVPYPLAMPGSGVGESVSWEWLLGLADALLYRAKEMGRKRAEGILLKAGPPEALPEDQLAAMIIEHPEKCRKWAELLSLSLDGPGAT